jgi:hypothetical protein
MRVLLFTVRSGRQVKQNTFPELEKANHLTCDVRVFDAKGQLLS